MTHDLFRHRPALRRPEAQPPQRASLEGLEVSESDFGEWLEAGGERRADRRETTPTSSAGDA
ncbi:MAG: hypothetical protein ACK4F7_07050 [Inhella sp.]